MDAYNFLVRDFWHALQTGNWKNVFITLCVVGLFFIVAAVAFPGGKLHLDHSFKVTFKKKPVFVKEPAGDPLLTINARKISYIIALIGFYILFICAMGLLHINDMFNFTRQAPIVGGLFFVPPVIIVAFIVFFHNQFFTKLIFYENALLKRSLLNKTIYYYGELDILEAINLNKDGEQSYAYVFKTGSTTILKLRSSRYKNLWRLEQAFTEHNPYVAKLETQTLAKLKQFQHIFGNMFDKANNPFNKKD